MPAYNSLSCKLGGKFTYGDIPWISASQKLRSHILAMCRQVKCLSSCCRIQQARYTPRFHRFHTPSQPPLRIQLSTGCFQEFGRTPHGRRMELWLGQVVPGLPDWASTFSPGRPKLQECSLAPHLGQIWEIKMCYKWTEMTETIGQYVLADSWKQLLILDWFVGINLQMSHGNWRWHRTKSTSMQVASFSAWAILQSLKASTQIRQPQFVLTCRFPRALKRLPK